MFGIVSWLRKATGENRPTLDTVVGAITAEVGRGVRNGERDASAPGFSVSVREVEVSMPMDASPVRDDEDASNTKNGNGVSIRTTSGGDGKLTLTITPDRSNAPPDQRHPDHDGDGRDVSTVESLSATQADALRSAGLSTVGDLADASTDAITSATNVSTERADRLSIEAKLLHLGARPQTAKLLTSLDYTVTKLATAGPASILERIEQALEDGEREIEAYEIDLAELDALVSNAEQAVDGEAERIEDDLKTAESVVESDVHEATDAISESAHEVEEAVRGTEQSVEDAVHDAENEVIDAVHGAESEVENDAQNAEQDAKQSTQDAENTANEAERDENAD